MTTEKITLELTLEELKQIDNSIGRYYNTAVLKDKIKDAYPLPKMYLKDDGKFEIVSYNDEIYYRLELSNAIMWYKKKDDINDKTHDVRLVHILDLETHRLLEGLFFNDVRKGEMYD